MQYLSLIHISCPECLGLGYKMEFDPDLMIPDKSLSISEGAIVVMGWQSCTDKSSFTNAILNALCREYGFDLDTPFKDYPKKKMCIRDRQGVQIAGMIFQNTLWLMKLV